MSASGVDVRVENQLVRFVPTSPVDHDAVISQLAGQKTVILSLRRLKSRAQPSSLTRLVELSFTALTESRLLEPQPRSYYCGWDLTILDYKPS